MFTKTNSDRTITELYAERYRIILKPQYQRNLVWDTRTKQHLVWCILRGQDVPKILFHIKGNGDESVFDVIDGQQRLDAIFSFRDNLLSLPKDAPPINNLTLAGLRYDKLPDTLKAQFDDYVIQVTSIRTDDTGRVIDQFLDLQRGRRLNGQERRQAPPGFVRDYVMQLAEHPFVSLTRINSKRYRKYEVISRLLIWEWNNAILPTDSTTLDRFYIEHANDTFDMKEWQQLHKRMTQTLDELNSMFVKPPSGLRGVVMFMLTYWLWRNIRRDYIVTDDVRERFPEWFVGFHTHIKHQENDEEAQRWLRKWSGASNAAKSNIERYDYMYRLLLYEFPHLAARDKRRHFAEEQRYLIFDRAGGQCEWVDDNGHVCGYLFNWADDWEPDHVVSHTDGGLTTLENGRVLCRYRNRANGRGVKICAAMANS